MTRSFEGHNLGTAYKVIKGPQHFSAVHCFLSQSGSGKMEFALLKQFFDEMFKNSFRSFMADKPSAFIVPRSNAL